MFGTVVVMFLELATTRLHLATSLKINKVVLLPVYFGRRTSRVKVENILRDVNVLGLLAAILLGMEKEVVVLQAIRIPHRKWKLQRFRIVVPDVERMVETTKVGDTTLKVRVEGRIPRCYECLKGHI